jgi:hypothetical protein
VKEEHHGIVVFDVLASCSGCQAVKWAEPLKWTADPNREIDAGDQSAFVRPVWAVGKRHLDRVGQAV